MQKVDWFANVRVVEFKRAEHAIARQPASQVGSHRQEHALKRNRPSIVAAAVMIALWSTAAFARVDPIAPVGDVLVLTPTLINADSEHQWIAAAIQQSLVADLTRHLPQTVQSIEHSAPSKDDAIVSARRVDAGDVIVGSVQLAGQQLRFTGQIVDVKTSRPIAALKLTGRVDDIFSLEDSIAQEATRALMPRRAGGDTKPIAIVASGPLRIDLNASNPAPGMEYALPYQDNRFQAESDRYFFGSNSCNGYWGWGFGFGVSPFCWSYSPYPTASPGWAW